MRLISNSDHDTIMRILEWAAVQGGSSTRDAEKRRQIKLILKKMARYIKKGTVSVGDFIEVMGDVYIAAMQTVEDCSTQCDFYDDETGRCRGTCYRYQEEGIVFHLYGSLREIKGSIRICETRCWDKVKDKLLKADQCRRRMEMRRFMKSESEE